MYQRVSQRESTRLSRVTYAAIGAAVSSKRLADRHGGTLRDAAASLLINRELNDEGEKGRVTALSIESRVCKGARCRRSAAIRVIGFPFAAFAPRNDGNFGIPQLRAKVSMRLAG